MTGAELRRWREVRELTQEQMAEMIGVSRRTLVTLESKPDQPVRIFKPVPLTWADLHNAEGDK